MNRNITSLIRNSKFISYLDSLGIDSSEVNDAIIQGFNEDEFEHFVNSSNGMLSPNTYIYDLVFKHVNEFLYQQYRELVIFEGEGTIDVRTMIATSNSLVSRPDLLKPFDKSPGFSAPDELNDFVVIARFERQFEARDYGSNTKGNRAVICEGCLPMKININPLKSFPCTQDIWKDEYCYGTPAIQGFCINENSLEAAHVIWMNGGLLSLLGLILDRYDNGLRALNDNGEAVLIYRCWREKLIGKGPSFVGLDSNISRLEGCDLILRKDFYEKLKTIIPDIVFYTEII
ncbi:hypothetical protein [Vibrio rumoiensis]|uniref:Uncharacterized protein n=1 Tax=Vibrio rumoiensis 1S-45 TaxID=1188252 RepID=A0A1E5E7A1_9VIBR|nr:hypothetical protein [Vibrio rumoiensis]OEF30230.1 hypothetical protein A1QC_00185 [Vibrio rumoiensis 1S-45]